jgi:signal transduction histidine kinase
LALIVHSEEVTAELLRSRARLVAARDEERHRISVDLHDGIGPSLAALGLQSHRAHALVRHDPDAAQRALEDMADEIRRTVADVRAIVAGMAPGELEANGLAACLPALIERFDSPAMTVELTCDLSSGDELPVGVEIAAYNVVAEALANAVAHAGAGRCTVAVSRNGRLEIDVVDDGSGLPSSLVAGIGIASMRRRVEACGGTFTIGAGPAGSTVVRARLPVSG